MGGPDVVDSRRQVPQSKSEIVPSSYLFVFSLTSCLLFCHPLCLSTLVQRKVRLKNSGITERIYMIEKHGDITSGAPSSSRPSREQQPH